MKRRFLILLIVCLMAMATITPALATERDLLATQDAQGELGPPTEYIVDGSFEGCTPSAAPDACPAWGEFSTQYGSPVCDAGWCGTGGGTAGPRTGTVWSWFGGAVGFENGYVDQSVTIPAGASATLTFYLWAGVWSGDTLDTFDVFVDAVSVFNLTGAALGAPPYNAGYTLVTLDLGAYADGTAHLLRFDVTTNSGVTNVSLDDVSLIVVTVDTLVATGTCNADNLQVSITTGDAPFDITGTGPGLPLSGVAAGTQTLTGPGSWTGVTVTETAGDAQSAVLGDFTCPSAVAAPPGIPVPNLGLVLIGFSQAQAAYQEPGGDPIAGVVLPEDADGNGFDTYVVTDVVVYNGEIWLGLFLGSANWGYVPLSKVLPLTDLPLPDPADSSSGGNGRN
jgi:hypothetical protein